MPFIFEKICKKCGCKFHSYSSTKNVCNVCSIYTPQIIKKEVNELYENEIWLKHQYVDLEKSAYRIAKECGICDITICRHLEKIGIKRRHRKAPVVPCAYCGKLLKRIPSRTKGYNYCNGKCQMVYEYKHEIRNPKTIALKAHKKMRQLAKEGKHPFQKEDVREIIRQNQQTLAYKKKASQAKLGVKNGMYGKTGKLNPNWKGGKIWWRGKEWDELKLQIRQRDNFECQACRMTERESLKKWGSPLQVHHIIEYRISKNNNPENLITVCNICHGKTNSNQDYWQFHFTNLLIERNIIPAINLDSLSAIASQIM